MIYTKEKLAAMSNDLETLLAGEPKKRHVNLRIHKLSRGVVRVTLADASTGESLVTRVVPPLVANGPMRWDMARTYRVRNEVVAYAITNDLTIVD